MSSEGGATRKLGDVKAHDAAFAPDGKTIIYAASSNLFLTDLQGRSSVKIASVPGRAFWLRWSPDGSTLRFSVVDPKKLTYTLWELKSNGELRQFLTQWAKDAQICCGIWTAKGEHFLFRKITNPGMGLWVWSEGGLRRTEPTLLNAGGMAWERL